MTTSKNSDWGGAFHNPIMKHRDYCGDITNHIRLISVVPATEDAIEEFSENSIEEFDELVSLGDGGQEWLVEMEWSDHHGQSDLPYAYRVNLPAEQLTPENAKVYSGANYDPGNVPNPVKIMEMIHDYHLKNQ